MARSLDPLLLQAQYVTACREGDNDGLIAAVENAPPLAAILRAEVIADGRKARVARLRPDTELLDQLASFYQYVVNSARNELKRHLPPREPELVKVQPV